MKFFFWLVLAILSIIGAILTGGFALLVFALYLPFRGKQAMSDARKAYKLTAAS